jgi:hypothetical protein
MDRKTIFSDGGNANCCAVGEPSPSINVKGTRRVPPSGKTSSSSWVTSMPRVISGPIAPIYGPGVIDIDLRRLRGQSLRFFHTSYWSMQVAPAPPHVAVLRDALDLAGQRPL